MTECDEIVIVKDNVLDVMHIRFDKIDGMIRIYEGTRDLTLFSTKKNDAVYDRIRYLISLESSIKYIFSLYFAKTKVDSYDSLAIEKIATLHNVVCNNCNNLQYSLNQFLIKIKITTTIRYF